MWFYYGPNFEEVEEAYWFGPVRPWITLCIWSRTVRDRILKFDIWNKFEKIRGHIFIFIFSVGLLFSLQSYVSFSTFFFFFFFFFAMISLWNLVNKISGELLELGS